MRPITHCYWVVPGKFLAGEYPINLDKDSSILKVNALTDAGVSVFVDLTEENEGLRSYKEQLMNAKHLRFPIVDNSVPRSTEITTSILDTIDHYIQQGEVVYLHCWGGVGRTGLIVGCWLTRHGYQGDAALERLQELWERCPKSIARHSPETIEQEQYVYTWAAEKPSNWGQSKIKPGISRP